MIRRTVGDERRVFMNHVAQERDGVINCGDGSVRLEEGVVERAINVVLLAGYERIEDFLGF